MANERNIIIQDGSNPSITTYSIGDSIQFYTDNRYFKVKSPVTASDWPENDTSKHYYKKVKSEYQELTRSEFLSIVEDNTNNTTIYIEVGTQKINCECGTGKITVNGRQYTCPACKGKKVLIKAVGENDSGCAITGISVFFPQTGPIQEKYRVTPPGSVTSILIAKEDVLRKVSSSS